MNLDKLTHLLCLAFQCSDGPFQIKVSYSDHDEWASLSKEEIKNLSDQQDIKQIDICNPGKDRRWHQRLGDDRRTNRI